TGSPSGWNSFRPARPWTPFSRGWPTTRRLLTGFARCRPAPRRSERCPPRTCSARCGAGRTRRPVTDSSDRWERVPTRSTERSLWNLAREILQATIDVELVAPFEHRPGCVVRRVGDAVSGAVSVRLVNDEKPGTPRRGYRAFVTSAMLVERRSS